MTQQVLPTRRGRTVARIFAVLRQLAVPVALPLLQIRSRLFAKYVTLFVVLASVALLANGALEIWFCYREDKVHVIRIQREQAEGAATKIGQFIKGIEAQLGWTVQLPWDSGTFQQRRIDARRLLRQVSAISELEQ